MVVTRLGWWCAAITCLPVAFSRVVNTTDVVPGTVVHVSCAEGQVLTNGHMNMTASCGTDGNWSPNIPDCRGLATVLSFCALILA